VHPDWLRTAARAKRERLLLITDRVALPGGARAGAAFGASIESDGSAWRLPDGRLAASHLHLDEAVRNCERWRVMTRPEAIAACTLRPARVLGLERERGSLRPGARADLVLWSEAGEVLATWVEGRLVHRAAGAPAGLAAI
jgi:N-acetylglucosamine-6-phosphate deacetylase